MSATDSAAGEFDPRFFEAFGCLGQLLSQIQEAVRTKAAGRGPGGPWEQAFGRQKTRRAWPGGFPGKPGGFPGGPWGPGGAWGWPGSPEPPRGPKAGRGDVRAAILALLREGPRNGYQIMSEIEERSGGAWRPSPGAVYPALQQLADEGLIEAEESGGRAGVQPHRRGPPLHRGEPRDGARGVGVDGAGRARGGARPVRPGGTAGRHHRAGGPRRARPSRSTPPKNCWNRPGARCTRSLPRTTAASRMDSRGQG